MKSHRSLIWRVSFICAALTLISLAVLALFLTTITRNQAEADLEAQQKRLAAVATELARPYLSGNSGQLPWSNPALLGDILSKAVGGPVVILNADGRVLAASPAGGVFTANPAVDVELAAARQGMVSHALRASGSGEQELLFTTAPVMVDGQVVGLVRLATPAARPAAGSMAVILVFLGISSIIWGGLALLPGYLVARYSSRSLTSVQAVVEASRRMEQGDYDYRLPAGVYDETRQLTEAFNGMADTVRNVVIKLSGERDTLSAVLGTMADGVVVTDPGGRVSLFNPAARDLLGIRAQQIEGARFVELVRDNEIFQAINRCQEEQSRQQVDVSLILPLRYLSVIATPLDNNGGVLLTLHDLTRIRQVETSQREFVSNVSHELRNPMASIKAMVETLESGAMSDLQVALDFLSRMRGDVDRMNSMVNDLLELSRMESGQFKIDTEPMALEPLVDVLIKQFEEAAAAQGVELADDLAENLPPVMADGEKLTQVFVNLVENALKFTPPGGKIRIGAEAEGEQVRIVLEDTGVGIAPQHLPHIFERFYKVNRSRRDSGTGLGLSIVKQLVEAHGGQITVESKEGEGCAFSFSVPRSP